MGKIQHHVEKIRKLYPELGIFSAEINQDGQYNDVLVVNEALIFRFAKIQDAIEGLRNEITILHHLQDQISLPIPNPIYISVDTERICRGSVRHPMIPGKPLWRENVEKITNAEGG